jgi:hypothetical protein
MPVSLAAKWSKTRHYATQSAQKRTRVAETETAFAKKGGIMKKEDIWMIILVAFSILWTAAFGIGIFG